MDQAFAQARWDAQKPIIPGYPRGRSALPFTGRSDWAPTIWGGAVYIPNIGTQPGAFSEAWAAREREEEEFAREREQLRQRR